MPMATGLPLRGRFDTLSGKRTRRATEQSKYRTHWFPISKPLRVDCNLLHETSHTLAVSSVGETEHWNNSCIVYKPSGLEMGVTSVSCRGTRRRGDGVAVHHWRVHTG